LVILAVVAVLVPGVARSDTTFVIRASGDQEVPPTGSEATGACVATLNDAQNELSVTCTHNVQNVTAAHIHRAPRGVNGGVIFPFGNPASPIQGTWMNMTQQNVQDLFAGNLYVNVHSSAFPGGEIRGQLVRGLEAFHFPLSGLQEVPPTPSQATGACTGVLSALETEFAIRCEHTVGNPTASHIHAAPRGVNGGVIFNLGNPQSPIENTWQNLTPQNVADMRAEGHYVNVHSPQFPGGEIRGQIVHDGGCSGSEKAKAKCKGKPGNAKAKAIVKKGEPDSPVTLCLDLDACASMMTNKKGKAKQVWKGVDAAGDRTVTFHYACGDIDSAVVTCP